MHDPVGIGVFVNKILPLLFIFFLGYGLKWIRLFNEESGPLFLKFVFYVSIPCLIFISVSAIHLTPQFVYYPIIAILVTIISIGVSHVIGKSLRMNREMFGVFVLGTSIMNLSFDFPFLLAAYGEAGFSIASVFNLGSTILVLTALYYIACAYGNKRINGYTIFKKFASSSPLWALTLAIIFNHYEIGYPESVSKIFQIVGSTTTPLILFSLGLHFDLKIKKPFLVLLVIFLRIGFGFVIGLLILYIFHIEGLPQKVILICCASPSGFNTLTFSALEGLDTGYASSVVSYTILVSLFTIPLLMLLL